MSTFKVEVRPISEVKDHPNADRLSLCKVDGLGFQFVTQKNNHKIGELVVYMPVDSLLPVPLIEKLGMVGKFSGKGKNRIKTIKLRGEFSQGFVCDVKTIQDYLTEQGKVFDQETLTELLGIEKYEVEPVPCKAGNLVQLPKNVPVYDIEGVERNQNVIDYIIANKIRVWISEKLEGTNYSCTVYKDGSVSVNQRRHAIIELPEQGEHMFWSITRKKGIIDKCKAILNNADEITLRGELIGPGIRKNLYKLPEMDVRFFDIMINGKYISVNTFMSVMEYANLSSSIVPTVAYDVLLDEFLAGKSVVEVSNGKSALGLDLREGIVIKPMAEGHHPDIGRLIIKHRDREYLDKYEL